jgi:hypothetical protein
LRPGRYAIDISSEIRFLSDSLHSEENQRYRHSVHIDLPPLNGTKDSPVTGTSAPVFGLMSDS